MKSLGKPLVMSLMCWATEPVADDRTNDLATFESENTIVCIPPLNMSEGDTYRCGASITMSQGFRCTIDSMDSDRRCGVIKLGIVSKMGAADEFDWEAEIRQIFETYGDEIRQRLVTLQNTFNRDHANVYFNKEPMLQHKVIRDNNNPRAKNAIFFSEVSTTRGDKRSEKLTVRVMDYSAIIKQPIAIYSVHEEVVTRAEGGVYDYVSTLDAGNGALVVDHDRRILIKGGKEQYFSMLMLITSYDRFGDWTIGANTNMESADLVRMDSKVQGLVSCRAVNNDDII
ncbi:hypothetical protein KP803_11745 [Vibrio sp. ZSDE26]|uniref:Uncharacterized protein n=1 Tax=Vibrio amylolyticus TaxID=2847292 RepID=A0A9X1XL74_9VIBR|nr:hypothetical protein [Vibrio amylolyticus]MCK6263943.1 hypothetical protein [Vibrio amylolyticus]